MYTQLHFYKENRQNDMQASNTHTLIFKRSYMPYPHTRHSKQFSLHHVTLPEKDLGMRQPQ